MSLQYSNNISLRKFAAKRPGLNKTTGSADFSFYYTSASTQAILPVITQHNPKQVEYYHWGLIPSWIKNRNDAEAYRTKTYNAKSETIFKLPSFRGYIKRKRCLIPATGFIEWHLKLGVKYPLLIKVKQQAANRKTRPFCFGGIYSSWVDTDSGEILNTFSMITTPGNEMLSFLHNSNKRMPLILSFEDEAKWLNPDLKDEEITSMMQPYPDNLMLAHTIGRKFIFKDVDPDQESTLEPYEYKGLDLWFE